MYHHQVVVDKMNRYGSQTNPLWKKILMATLFISVLSFFFFSTSWVVTVRNMFHFVKYLIGLEKEPVLEQYQLKPFKAFPQVARSPWFYLNMFALTVFNTIVYINYGPVPILYFFLCNAFCNGLHPLGMRQVQEHYIQKRSQPTNSVYSPFGTLLLNIGYHNEHHDFPNIPWNRLPKLKEIAPEFYNNLFYWHSYTEVFIDFFKNEGIPYTSLLEDLYEEPPKQK
jgi:fatty acid desaturase